MRIGKEITAVFPVPNDPDGAEVTIIHLNPGQVEDIQERMKAYKTVMRRHGNTLEPEIEQNSDLGDKRYMFVVESIKDWKNFKDAKGKDLPCDSRTKIAVSRATEVTVTRDGDRKEVVAFPSWISECRSALAEQLLLERTAG